MDVHNLVTDCCIILHRSLPFCTYKSVVLIDSMLSETWCCLRFLTSSTRTMNLKYNDGSGTPFDQLHLIVTICRRRQLISQTCDSCVVSSQQTRINICDLSRKQLTASMYDLLRHLVNDRPCCHHRLLFYSSTIQLQVTPCSKRRRCSVTFKSHPRFEISWY